MPAANTTRHRRKRSRPAPKSAFGPRLTPLPVETTPVNSASTFGKLRVAPVILLALLTFSIYFQILHHPFSNYDDGEYVTDNPDIQHGINPATLRWAITSTEHGNWHPLTWLSHTLDWQLFGNNAGGHHFTNLLLHILNALLLFIFLAQVTGATGQSLFAAAIFAVHPINVESVAWVAERKNVLCTLFFLLALLAYSRYARRPGVIRYLVVALLFAFALAAKPMVVTFPFVLLLLDYWPLQRIKNWSQPSLVFSAPQFPAWKIALEKLPLLALSIGDCVLTLIAQNKVNAIKSVTKFSLSARLTNAVVSYAAYLWKTAWPLRLAVFYPHFAGRLAAWQVALCGVFLVGVSVWVWRERSRPYLMMGWCWFLGMMVPVIGLIQVGDQGMADRYAYLPLIGIFVAAVWGVADWAQHAKREVRVSTTVVATAVLVIFSLLAWRQARTWQSSLALWSQAVTVDPTNFVAEDVVGSEILLSVLNKGVPYSNEAQVHFQRALQINPRDSEALLNVGADLQTHGRVQEAIAKYKEALEYAQDPSIKGRILTDLGSAYERLLDLATARQYYREALKLGPKNAPAAFTGFARTYTDEQIVDLTRTLAAQPTAQGYWKLGQLQESVASNGDAIASYRRALQIDAKFQAAQDAVDRLAKGPERPDVPPLAH
jgi:tetratricopeptide (TPR) repeat protein